MMIAGTRLVLRLPPCLRQQVLAQEALCKVGIDGKHFPSRRAFASRSKPIQRSKSTPPRLQQKRPPSAGSTPATSTPPPAAAPPAPTPRVSANRAFIDTYEPLSERVLLYVSPNHGSFFAASYLIGGFLLLGGYTYAEMFLKDRPGQKSSWMLKSVSAFSTLCVVVFGTSFVLAPRKMIKSISIVSSKVSDTTVQSPRILRLEIKRALPFLRPDVLETSPKKVLLDRNVPMAVQDLNFNNIPKEDVQSFTERYFAPAQASKSSLWGALVSFNKSLLLAWPAVKRETRRMFLRDQMAYVEVEGNGTFKLDLQNCSMLDMGSPLRRIITADAHARPSLGRWISQVFKS